MTDIAIFDAKLADLSPKTLYELIALRTEVFVVEQQCLYQDLDGRELEDATRLLWAERSDEIISTLRILRDDDGVARIGRVATAAKARRSGVGTALMVRAIELIGGGPIVLSAQSHLADWYGQFGFVRDGDDFDEVGINHTPMRRTIAPAFTIAPALGTPAT